MAAVDSLASENNANEDSILSNHIDENRNDRKTRMRSSENADITQTANGNEEDESDTEHPPAVESNNIFGVKKILDLKVQNGITFYKVQWDDSWEPEYNLISGCMQLIKDFLAKRKKEKGKDKIIEGEEIAGKGGGYCLRVNKKKRKGNGWTGKKIPKQKRRRPDDQTSSDGSPGNSGQLESDGEENHDISSHGTPSPEDEGKTLQSGKKHAQKRKKLNNFLNGINNFGESDRETPPLDKSESPMESESQIDNPIAEQADPISTQDIPGEEIASTIVTPSVDTVTTSVMSAVTSVVSTCTASTTSSKTTEAECSSWLKLNKTTKGNPILLGDDSDEDTASQPPIVEDVKVKEEPSSGEEEEEVLFKRTAKLKASYVIRRLCETGDLGFAGESDEEIDPRDAPFIPDPQLDQVPSPVSIQLEDEDDDTDNHLSDPLLAPILVPTSGPLIADLPLPTSGALIADLPLNVKASPQSAKSVDMTNAQFPYDKTRVNDNNDKNNNSNNAIRTFTGTSPSYSHIRPIRTQPKGYATSSPANYTRPSYLNVQDSIKPPHLNIHNPTNTKAPHLNIQASTNSKLPHLTIQDPSNLRHSYLNTQNSMNTDPPNLTIHNSTKPLVNILPMPCRPPILQKIPVENWKSTVQVSPAASISTPIASGSNHTNKLAKEVDKPEVICVDGAIDLPSSSRMPTPNSIHTNIPVFPPRYAYGRVPTDQVLNKKLGMPLKFNVPIQYLPNEYVEAMLTRILFQVKTLIEKLKLDRKALPDLLQGLIIKAVVLTIKESYNSFEKCEANFIATQVNDLSQIALKELPFKKLMDLLYNHCTDEGPTNGQLVNKENKIVSQNATCVTSQNATSVTPKPSASVLTPIASMNAQVGTSEVVGVPTIRPMSVSNVMTFVQPFVPPPIGMILGQIPVAHQQYVPHAGFLSNPPMDPSRHPFNLMGPRPQSHSNVHLVNSGLRPVSISELRPVNILPKTRNLFPNTAFSDARSVNRLTRPVFSQSITRPNRSSSTVVASVAVIPSVAAMSISPPPITVINSPRFTPVSNTILPCNITNVRSLKVTQPEQLPGIRPLNAQRPPIVSPHERLKVLSSERLKGTQPDRTKAPNTEPIVESIDIHDDELTINKVVVKNVTSSNSHISPNPSTNTKTPKSPSLSSTPKVKTVLGPHRFYKPPRKLVSESKSPSASSPESGDPNSMANRAKRKQKVRYKDLVNQKFAAKPVTTCDKVVDLTDGDVVSLDDSDNESDNDTINCDTEKEEDTEKSDSEKSDAEKSGAEKGVTEKIDLEKSDTENIDLENSTEKINTEKVNSEKIDPEKIDTEKLDTQIEINDIETESIESDKIETKTIETEKIEDIETKSIESEKIETSIESEKIDTEMIETKVNGTQKIFVEQNDAGENETEKDNTAKSVPEKSDSDAASDAVKGKMEVVKEAESNEDQNTIS